MPRRTSSYTKFPWTGGINSSIDPGVLNDNDLVTADNVIFTTSGSRLKREGFSFVDNGIPAASSRSSSGTTRTIYWETALIQGDDDLIVAGQQIDVTTTATVGNELQYVGTFEVLTFASTAEVTNVVTVADVAGSLNSKYFFLSEGRLDTNYTFYYSNGTGVDPAISGRTSVVILYTNGDSANTIASLTQAVVDALADFSATVVTNTVTVTASDAGPALDGSSETSGFTVTVTVQGADQITYTAGSALAEARVTTTTLSVSNTSAIINIIDYWRFNTLFVKEQLLLAGTREFQLFSYDENGQRTQILPGAGATEPAAPLLKLNSIIIENKAIFAFPVRGDLPIKYNPDDDPTYELLGGSPPDFAIMCEHLGRLWVNDKDDPDRLHYSSTGNVEEWEGVGDSGALDISPGDGDIIGINGIYVFKGILFVGKGRRLFRVDGTTPEDFQITVISNGLGIESHQASVAVDQDDVAFVSKRGFHSTVATDTFGDVASSFLSLKIQNDFTEFEQDELKYMQGVYIPEINSLAFSITEEGQVPNDIWLFNVVIKEWYRWPNISCTALSKRFFDGNTELLIGTNSGRIARYGNGTFTDFEVDGITYRIKTGTIYPGGSLDAIKGFKSLAFLFRAFGSYQFTCNAKIDNAPTQGLNFAQTSGGDLLGIDFILGTSILGSDMVLAPFERPLEGHGRGVVLEIIQSGINQQAELLGYIIEFEEEEIVKEVI